MSAAAKSKLAEILASGQPPGFAGVHPDPQGPDAAIPRALKQMEEKQSARDIARGAGWSVDTLKRTWNM